MRINRRFNLFANKKLVLEITVFLKAEKQIRCGR
jgi:hypothetical protein